VISCTSAAVLAILSKQLFEGASGAAVQVVTAGVLIWALYRPLSRRSLFPKWRPAVAWRMPTLQGAFNFVAYAGPICGVLITKVIVYGEQCTDSLPLQSRQLSCMPNLPCKWVQALRAPQTLS
jgi:hypothetical protein